MDAAIEVGFVVEQQDLQAFARALQTQHNVGSARRWMQRRRVERRRRALGMGPFQPYAMHLRLDDYGVHIETDKGSVERPWSVVRAIEVADGLLMIRSLPATVVPRRAFRSDIEWNAFVSGTRELDARHGQPS